MLVSSLDFNDILFCRMGYSTVLTLIVLTVEKCVVIFNNNASGRLDTAGVKRASIILFFIWPIAVVSALPTIANTKMKSLYFSAKTNKFIFIDYQSRYSLFDSNHPTKCLVPDSEICGYYYNEEDEEDTPSYISISTLIFFILPMILLAMLYISIRIRTQRISASNSRIINQKLMRENTIWLLGSLYHFLISLNDS